MINAPQNVYLCQFSTDIKGKIAFFPYSAGSVWAYAESQGVVKRSQLSGIFFLKKPLQEALDKFIDPDIVGFSNYAWNGNYNLALSKLIKERYPDCTIIFGGPETPDNCDEWFKKEDHIDILVHQEGERAFTDILSGKELSEIPNISFSDGNKVLTNQSVRLPQLDDVPSPYLVGLFDNLDHEGYVLNAIIETDRGCPFKCTFCDWGGVTFSKVKRFNLEKIFGEIEWAGKNKVEMIQSADANFGIFKERAELIADQLVKTKAKYGYPKKFDTSWAKNSNETVLDIAGKLKSAEMGSRFDLSVQSLNSEVQKNIERSNLGINKFEELVGLARKKQLVATVELILVLPGETYESWVEGIYELLEHDNIVIEVNPAQLLKNSALNSKEHVEKFGIKAIESDFGEWSSHYVPELAKYIIETKDMSYQDLLKSWQFTWCARLGHVLGLTNILLEKLQEKYDITPRKFYGKWFNYVTSSSGIINEAFQNWNKKYLLDNEFVSFTYEFGYLEKLGNTHRNQTLKELEEFIEANFDHVKNKDLKEALEFFDIAYYNPNLNYPYKFKDMIIDHPGPGIFEDYYMFVGMTRRHGGWRCKIKMKADKAVLVA